MQKQTDNRILYLDSQVVTLLCQNIDSVEIMRDVFSLHGSGQTVLPDEAYLSWSNDQKDAMRSLNMPGYLGGTFNTAGTKIINGNIQNPQRGLPRASGLTMLYDNTSACITCIMAGAHISSLRTASVSALAVDVLTRTQIHTLAIIGAGVLAQVHIELLVKRLPHIERILLFDLDKQRALHLQHSLSDLLTTHKVILTLANSAEEAIRPAQLIIPTTTTTVGYIHYAWLAPGSILVNVSLDDPLPEVILKADIVVVDDWKLVKDNTRRLIGRMYQQGQVVGPDDLIDSFYPHRRKIDAQLGEIICGTKQLSYYPGNIIVVNPFGLAIEDLALAYHIYQAAQKQNLGVWLER